ncbi:hypothetical protein ACEQ8H_004600 [Pleosporales sp. CAS-2024a]
MEALREKDGLSSSTPTTTLDDVRNAAESRAAAHAIRSAECATSSSAPVPGIAKGAHVSHPACLFSSLPRTAGLSAPACRAGLLQTSASSRAGATGHAHLLLPTSGVRNGSWYAPWSWGKSSTPAAGAEQVPVAEMQSDAVSHHVEAAVTSDTPAHVNGASDAASPTADLMASFKDAKTLDDLLGVNPVKDVAPKLELDPTALIHHMGHLTELGLDYGWGMTTLFERTVELIYLYSGFGWAGTIVTAGVMVRCATFYFQARSSDKMAALAALKPLTQPLQEKMEAAIARGDQHAENTYKMQQANIMKPHMGGMFSLGGFMFLQAWVGFSAFRCLRAMAELPVPGLMQDGLLWFQDLTVPDPYYILPSAVTAVFFFLFKYGGETGVANAATGLSDVRRRMMSGFSFIMGAVALFQPAALQLYFFVTGVLGAMTGFLLKQNWCRRAIGIHIIPSPQSNELYQKVMRGEVKLSDIKDKDGKVRYQAPRDPAKPAKPANRPTAAIVSGIRVRQGTEVPAHLKAPTEVSKPVSERNDRDVDYEEGAKGTLAEKMSYYRRNYRPAFVYRRLQGAIDEAIVKMGLGPNKGEAQRRRRERAERYEIERRRRFENRL